MSGQLVGLVLDVDPEKLPASQRWVLAAIAEQQRGVSDVVIRTEEWLSRRAGLGASTVRRALGPLREKGYLSYWGGGGRGTANRFRLNVVRDAEDRFQWAPVDNPVNPLAVSGYPDHETRPHRAGKPLNPLADDINPLAASAVPSPVSTPSVREQPQTSLLLPFTGGQTDGPTEQETQPPIDVAALVASVRELGFPAPQPSAVRQEVVPTAVRNGHTVETLLAALRRQHSPHKIRLRNGTVTALRDVARDPAPTPVPDEMCPHKIFRGHWLDADGVSPKGCVRCELDAKALSGALADTARELRMP